jgi:ABC-type enterochelin transport system ATPase subunit
MDDRKLNIARAKAYKLGIENWKTLKNSEAKNKRFSILSPSGKLLNFGLYPYTNGTFIDHHDKKIRENWKARHIKIMKNRGPAYLNKESPEYYSWHILW